MKTHQSTFTGQADLRSMEALAREFRTDNLHVTDLPYHLGSALLGDPENIRLWRDGNGELLGWMVMHTSFIALDFAIRPEVEKELLPAMLAWAHERSLANIKMVPLGTPEDGPCWFVNVFADMTERLHILETAGFASQADVGEYSWSKVWLQRPTDLPVKDYRIPAGFTVRPLKGEMEADAYVALHRATFGSTIMNADWRRRTIQHPSHVADLDLVVEAPDGKLAAFCVCWLDAEAQVGQIEPLGCHPDYRRYALGRIALAEGLRRLQAHGARQVFVETDSWRSTAKDLYESVGFQLVRDVLVYRKDY